MKCQAMPKGEEKKGQVSKRLNKQDIWSKNIPDCLAKSLPMTSDVRYISINPNIDICIQYRDTILALGCINTLEWTV